MDLEGSQGPRIDASFAMVDQTQVMAGRPCCDQMIVFVKICEYRVKCPIKRADFEGLPIYIGNR